MDVEVDEAEADVVEEEEVVVAEEELEDVIPERDTVDPFVAMMVSIKLVSVLI